MRKVNLEVFAEFVLMLKEKVEHIEWDHMQEIPCYVERNCDLDDWDEDEYLLEVESYIQNAFKAEYGTNVIIDFTNINLISATDEETNYTHYFN